jgi:hypothetical protein
MSFEFRHETASKNILCQNQDVSKIKAFYLAHLEMSLGIPTLSVSVRRAFTFEFGLTHFTYC